MKKLALLIITISISFSLSSQTFETDLPMNFSELSIRGDLFGSLDKKGIISVISYSSLDFEWLEWSFELQSIINGDSLSHGWNITYVDFQGGIGYYIPLNTSMSITPSIHGGLLVRPKDVIINKSYEGWTGFFVYGVELKGRWFLGKSKKFTILVAGSFDKAPDVKEKWGRINGNAGIGFTFK